VAARDALLEAARSSEAFEMAADDWGIQWRLDATLRRHEMDAVVRTIWIIRADESSPKFVSCWVL
jgi:hypothetical protein